MALTRKIARDVRIPGLVMLAVAVVLATVLTVNPFSPAGVGAHVPDANQDDECDVSHEDFQGTPCTESGRDEPHENII